MAATSNCYSPSSILGSAYYVFDYLSSYASFAAPLIDNLNIGREEGSKESMVKVKWDEEGE